MGVAVEYGQDTIVMDIPRVGDSGRGGGDDKSKETNS